MVFQENRWAVILSICALLFTSLPAYAQELININEATVESLLELPGIGPVKAGSIVQFRESNGDFQHIGQLLQVRGIGQVTLNNLSSLISVGDQAAHAQEITSEYDTEPVIDLTSDEHVALSEGHVERASEFDPVVREPAPEESVEISNASLININVATTIELVNLPGIGPSKAQAIVEHRETHGPFQTINQLEDVRGIGPSTMNRIREMVLIQ
jgi:competence protein ComEA